MSDKKIAIIDFELGNLFSVKHACFKAGLKNVVITNRKEDILNADAIILPGVGAFGDAMKNLEKSDLILPVKDFISSGKPFLGICLGMQLLFTESEEFGIHKGLSVIDGTIKKFPNKNQQSKTIKVPQIGWNNIRKLHKEWENTPLNGIKNEEYMYFVHSYYALPDKEQDILTVTGYEETEYCSSVIKNNVFAVQYHPEKSAVQGLKIYENWALSLK